MCQASSDLRASVHSRSRCCRRAAPHSGSGRRRCDVSIDAKFRRGVGAESGSCWACAEAPRHPARARSCCQSELSISGSAPHALRHNCASRRRACFGAKGKAHLVHRHEAHACGKRGRGCELSLSSLEKPSIVRVSTSTRGPTDSRVRTGSYGGVESIEASAPAAAAAALSSTLLTFMLLEPADEAIEHQHHVCAPGDVRMDGERVHGDLVVIVGFVLVDPLAAGSAA